MKKNGLTYNSSSGFKVPNKYFENLEDVILQKIAAENQGMPKYEHGFKTPDAYFDTLEDKVFAKLASKETSKVIPLYKKKSFIYYSGIAAVMLALITTLLFKPVEKLTFENIEYTYLEGFINENEFDLNYNEISSFMFEEGYVIDSNNISDLDDEILWEYISQNVEDPSLIE